MLGETYSWNTYFLILGMLQRTKTKMLMIYGCSMATWIIILLQIRTLLPSWWTALEMEFLQYRCIWSVKLLSKDWRPLRGNIVQLINYRDCWMHIELYWHRLLLINQISLGFDLSIFINCVYIIICLIFGII